MEDDAFLSLRGTADGPVPVFAAGAGTFPSEGARP